MSQANFTIGHLKNVEIEYHWHEALGGRRSKGTGVSINLGIQIE